MFDKLYVLPERRTHVTVNQQPNDAADAARLHGQIRAIATAQAEAELLRAIVEQVGAENCLRVLTAETQLNIATRTQHFHAIVDINGYQLKLSGEASVVRDRVERTVADEITRLVMRQLFGRR